MLLSSIRERHKEIQLLRGIGASPSFLFCLIILETLFILVISIVLSEMLLFISILLAQDYVAATFGVHVTSNMVSMGHIYLVLFLLSTPVILAFISSVRSVISSPNKK